MRKNSFQLRIKEWKEDDEKKKKTRKQGLLFPHNKKGQIEKDRQMDLLSIVCCCRCCGDVIQSVFVLLRNGSKFYEEIVACLRKSTLSFLEFLYFSFCFFVVFAIFSV